ncbi:hypothetical protein K9F62_11190 [Desulfovibrio sp. JY]|nr:hypothetical protein K9F62_11190 [Desulfovibrio sp. JY]
MSIKMCPYSEELFDADDSISEYVSDDVYRNIFLKLEEEEEVDIEYFASHPQEFKEKLKKIEDDERLELLRSCGIDV